MFKRSLRTATPKDEPAAVRENFKRPIIGRATRPRTPFGNGYNAYAGLKKALFGSPQKKSAALKPARRPGAKPLDPEEKFNRMKTDYETKERFKKWKSEREGTDKPEVKEPSKPTPQATNSKSYDPINAAREHRRLKKIAWRQRNPNTPDPTDANYSPPKSPSTGKHSWDKNSEEYKKKMHGIGAMKRAEDEEVKRRGKPFKDSEYVDWYNKRKKANEAIDYMTEASDRHVNPNGSYNHDFNGLSQLASQSGRMYTPDALKAELKARGKVQIGDGTYHYSLQSRAQDDVKKFMETEGPEITRLQLTPKELIIHYNNGEPIVHKLGDGSRRTYYQHFYKAANERLKAIRGTKVAKLKESLSPSGNRIFKEIMHEMESNSFGIDELKNKIANRIKTLSDEDQLAIRKRLTGK
jgi:hypothetical protein